MFIFDPPPQKSNQDEPEWAKYIREFTGFKSREKQLEDALKMILPVLKSMPAPKVGEWDWPYLATVVEKALKDK